MDTISWKMSNSFIHKDSISRQVLSLNGTATFKHSHIKLRLHYKSAQMFTFNKSWTSNIWKHTGRESTRPCAHAQARRPTRPQTFNESFYQCHLIPQKVKVASVERAVVVFGQKSTCCPRFWKPGIKTTFPPPRRGTNFRVLLHVGVFAGVMNEHISKGAIILKQANTPQCGVKRRDFDKEPYPIWYLRSTSRNVHFTGMLSPANDKPPPLNTNNGTLNRGLFVRQFNLGMKSRDIWWHSWLLLLISVGGK